MRFCNREGDYARDFWLRQEAGQNEGNGGFARLRRRR